jgi:hypothetical protein
MMNAPSFFSYFSLSMGYTKVKYVKTEYHWIHPLEFFAIRPLSLRERGNLGKEKQA